MGGPTTSPEKFAWIAEAAAATTNDCIEWPWGKFGTGYGAVWDGARTLVVTRLVLHAAGRPWHPPLGFFVRHSCHNPPCCNPRHLSYGTTRANATDMVAAGRAPKGGNSEAAAVASRITAADVAEARRLYFAGLATKREIARSLDVSRHTVGNWVKGKRRVAQI